MSRDKVYLTDILNSADSQNDLPLLIARLEKHLAAQSENPDV